MARQREHRLGIAGAERPRRLDRLRQRDRRAGRGQRRVDRQAGVRPRRRHRRGELLFEKSAELADARRGERDSRRHRVAAALDREAGIDRGAHDAAEIDAGDRATRAGRLGAVQRQRECRPLEPLLEPRRDEADDAARPTLARDDDRRAALLEPERQQRFRLGLGQRRDLDLLARAVQRDRVRRRSCAPPSSSRVVSSLTPSAASPMRPPALMRGPMRKPR